MKDASEYVCTRCGRTPYVIYNRGDGSRSGCCDAPVNDTDA